MSDDPQKQAANPPEDEPARENSSSNKVPQEELSTQDLAAIERNAVDARVRRAPRYGRFIFVGALIGAVAGILAALVVRIVSDQSVNFGAVTIFSALGLGTLGALICGIIAVVQDRRSATTDELPESHTDMGE